IPEGEVRSLALSHELRRAAVVTREKELHLWDLSPDQPQRHPLDLPDRSGHWITFLGDDRTLVAVNKQGKITLWDLSGPNPQWQPPGFAGKTLEELEPPERELLGARVRRPPAGAPLPDEWRAAFLPWTRRLRARVTESGVAVTREGRDGKETT